MGKARSWLVVRCTRCKQPLNRENADYVSGLPYGRRCAQYVRKERGLTFESALRTGEEMANGIRDLPVEGVNG